MLLGCPLFNSFSRTQPTLQHTHAHWDCLWWDLLAEVRWASFRRGFAICCQINQYIQRFLSVVWDSWFTPCTFSIELGNGVCVHWPHRDVRVLTTHPEASQVTLTFSSFFFLYFLCVCKCPPCCVGSSKPSGGCYFIWVDMVLIRFLFWWDALECSQVVAKDLCS